MASANRRSASERSVKESLDLRLWSNLRLACLQRRGGRDVSPRWDEAADRCASRRLGTRNVPRLFCNKLSTRKRPLRAEPPENLPSPVKSLGQLAEAEESCRRCPLYRDATQVVPGEGPHRASFMLVGEQPGDKEDTAGKPFVGPTGRLLDRALADAGIRRAETFVTNAVKHFKHEMRGKRRLHKRPDNYEVERCKIWLDWERHLVKPDIIVALGVTAARSLTGRTITIGRVRGKPIAMADGTRLIVTMHPSALLRIKGDAERQAAYLSFVADLEAAVAVYSNGH
jgi:uracil-DNA glycosylase